MEYHSAIKKKETLPFATTWLELEGIMLSEISQSDKELYDLTDTWNLRNKTEDHGRRGKNKDEIREGDKL